MRCETTRLRSQLYLHRLIAIFAAAVLALSSCDSANGGDRRELHDSPVGVIEYRTATPGVSGGDEGAAAGGVAYALAWPEMTPTPTPAPAVVAVAPYVPPQSPRGASVQTAPVQQTTGGCPAIIVEVFGAQAAAACAISWCESTWNADATGEQGERGYFQVHPRYHADATWDPEGNARAAYRISGGGVDWSAWTCRRVLG